MQEFLAFLVVSALVVSIAIVLQRRIGGALGQLVFIALCLRIVGSTLRYEVVEFAYGGGSDAKSYFRFGQMYAERIAQFDFGFFFGDANAIEPRWWGTQFVRSVTAIVVFAVGENIRAAFVVFACFAFVGQYFIVEAFGNAYGREARVDFARWAWLWPSLWFWPSGIGKEALIMLGLGLFTWGYVGQNGVPRWRALLVGILLTSAIRPHVAMVFGLSIAVAELLRRRATSRQAKWLSILAVVILAGISIRFGLSQLGLADADLEGIEEYFEHRAFTTEQGGSRISRPRGPLAIPVALANVFLRPFPWEARGMQALSSAETWFFWLMLFYKRRGLMPTLRSWRTNRFMVLAAPLGFALAMLYGLAFANLGIIARQRVLVLVFLISLLAVPRVVAVRHARGKDRATPRFGVRDGPQRSQLP